MHYLEKNLEKNQKKMNIFNEYLHMWYFYLTFAR